MLELETIMTIPNTWILLFKIKGQSNWKYLDCEELMRDFPYANELGLNKELFQTVKRHKTKISWFEEKLDICLDRLIVDGIDLVEK